MVCVVSLARKCGLDLGNDFGSDELVEITPWLGLGRMRRRRRQRSASRHNFVGGLLEGVDKDRFEVYLTAGETGTEFFASGRGRTA